MLAAVIYFLIRVTREKPGTQPVINEMEAGNGLFPFTYIALKLLH